MSARSIGTSSGLSILAVLTLACMVGCEASGVDDDDHGADGQPDVERPTWDDTAGDSEGLEPVEGVETEDEIAEDPAAAYLPIPTGPLGGDRPAKVTLPDDYDPAAAWPLVMLLHGYSASGFIQDYYLDLGGLVDERDFIYVLPEGTVDSDGKQFWNAVPGCCNWDGSAVDDLGYLVGLVEEAMEKYHVDPTRVVLMGHSNGGYMSHRLACDRSDLFTAIASIAGTSYANMDVDCAAAHPVSVLQIHGTADATVDYVEPFAGVGAEDTVAWWVDRAGCEPGVDLGYRNYDAAVSVCGELGLCAVDGGCPEGEVCQGDETACTGWSGGESGTSVELWKMLETSHIPVFSASFTPAVLDFLLDHPRQ
jgi:polyhydroxybutyrate depolymerase